MKSDQARGVRAAVAAYLLWGLLTAYWKLLGDQSPWQLIGWRVASATVLIGAFCAATARWSDVVAALSNPKLAPRIVLSSSLLIGNWTSYVWAVANDRVIETALGYFLAPLFTMLIGIFAFGEPLSLLRRIALGCTVVAVSVLVYSYGAVPWAALIIAASWSAYAVTKRQIPLGPFTSLTSELVVLFVPAVGVAAYSLISTNGLAATAASWQWPLVVGTGLITLLPLTLFAFAAPRVPFTVLGPLNFIVPIINFGLGWAVYNESMPADRVVGFGFVWAALVLVTIDTLGRKPQQPQRAS